MSGIENIAGDRYPHGTRARYVGGRCRCEPCRKANREYAKARAHADYNGLVDAAPARAHLIELSSQGIGRRAVADACDVALSVIQDVKHGKGRIRADTLKRILAVDAGAIADHALVSSKATRAALREMQRLGLTKTEIAVRLGSTATEPNLQLTRNHVTALNALKVRKLLAEVRAEVAAGDAINICTDCGQSHDVERRLAWLITVEADTTTISEEQPCWYGGENGMTRLRRDLKTLRERRAA